MRILVSVILVCAVWLAAAQAMADVEAVCTANSIFTCYYGSIYFSAEDSTTTVGDLDYVEWDWDNNGIYDEGDTWERMKSVSHLWNGPGQYYVTVRVWNSFDEWDTATAGPFLVARPVITADPSVGRTPLEVDFSMDDGLPPGLTRSYKWYFDWDPPTLPTGPPDSTDPAPTHIYNVDAGTYYCLVLVTYGGNSAWVCNDVQIIEITP